MDMFHDLIGSVLITYSALFISLLFVYAFQICLMLAVGFDCKAKGIKRRAMWMVLTVFFPIPTAIIYACVRNSEEKENYKKCVGCNAVLDERVSYCVGCGCGEFVPCEAEKKQKYMKNSKTCLIISIVSYMIYCICIFGFVFSIFSMVDGPMSKIIDDSFFNHSYHSYSDDNFDYEYHYGYESEDKMLYYDREGKSYTDDLMVVYYDRQNNTYTYDDSEYEFVSSDGKKYQGDYSYVDAEGYFYFDAAGYENDAKSTIFYSAKYDCYVDKDDNKYFDALEVSWDKNGNLIDSYEGENLLDEGEPTE